MAPEPAPGEMLGHYCVDRKLAEGGMGVVYKARDTRQDRLVAIKVLPAEKVADPERKRRFVQEAKAASVLNHPNIITVCDIDQTDGVDFIAMEYVEGKTLDELIGRKGLKLNEALKYAVQIAEALAKAHAAGIVHRDLKPGNVIVTGDGRVKVLDFGLAKLTETAPAGHGNTTLTEVPKTDAGLIVGTVSYMSPEQAGGCASSALTQDKAMAAGGGSHRAARSVDGRGPVVAQDADAGRAQAPEDDHILCFERGSGHLAGREPPGLCVRSGGRGGAGHLRPAGGWRRALAADIAGIELPAVVLAERYRDRVPFGPRRRRSVSRSDGW